MIIISLTVNSYDIDNLIHKKFEQIINFVHSWLCYGQNLAKICMSIVELKMDMSFYYPDILF